MAMAMGEVNGSVPEAHIVGGTVASPRQRPWQVSLREQGLHVCEGSLISHQWVLTAAHCISSSVNLQDLTVQLGESVLHTSLRSSVSAATISSVRHPSFNRNSLQGGGVVLVKLAWPVPFSCTIRPIPLASLGSSFPEGTLCWWPCLEPHRLQEVDVHITGLQRCHRFCHSEPITKEMMCAGYFQGQKSFCEGDYGGPLVCQLQDKRWVQGAVRPNRMLGPTLRQPLGVCARTPGAARTQHPSNLRNRRPTKPGEEGGPDWLPHPVRAQSPPRTYHAAVPRTLVFGVPQEGPSQD
ncbi:prostasin [Camelus ferus]|uniref:Prostasin n=1 Tax=Camelus ferus TaxID=419612 RepID=A0A8B8RE79_CAMFR|nr:prostasin [Camelus ferus]